MVDTTSINDMCDWERKKAIFLLGIAEDLRMNTSHGELAVNGTSGYTYLGLEDYKFVLYMPINCELVKTDISALWSCYECGYEEETDLLKNDTLEDIEERINKIEREHFKEEHPREYEEINYYDD